MKRNNHLLNETRKLTYSIAYAIALLIFGQQSVYPEILGKNQFIIWGYYPYWENDEWQKIEITLYDQILFFEIQISPDDHHLITHEWPDKWSDLISSSKKMKVHIIPTLTLFDKPQFERIFSNPLHYELLHDQILSLLSESNSYGIQLDFEIFDRVSTKSKIGYRKFLSLLSKSIHSQKKELSLFVLTDDSTGLYKKSTLENIDYIVIQGYDAHWKGSATAGPVALLHGKSVDSWDNALKHYLSLSVPRSKIIMSIPYFGYEWPTYNGVQGAQSLGNGWEISFAPLPADTVPNVKTSALERIKRYGFKRDSETGSPYYSFNNDTGWFQGWYEDETSLSVKFDFVKNEHLAGIAVFPLGYDGGCFENLLRSHFRSCSSNSNNSCSHLLTLH